ncbi:cellulase family glycosylhydrolase [Nocardioides sp. zg-ZUI104]|uniref:cellulase family glycosylhydrolase n=1 Tax=Nocardioides faecalis TaxID=2803858 RepID=UPI001BCD42F0|nr:cellulase family glycosylhydrolase [Nocardioides faecalis]MBS4752889.1 cellulase family glycosylhydrolase [Nocardioides faecalis]
MATLVSLVLAALVLAALGTAQPGRVRAAAQSLPEAEHVVARDALPTEAERKRPGTVQIRSRTSTGNQAAGTRFKARVWIRTQSTVRVALKVQERYAGKTVKSTTKRVKVRGGRWTSVLVPVTTRKSGSQVVVVVKAPRAQAKQKILVDHLTVAKTAGVMAATSAEAPDADGDTSGRRLTNGCTTSERGIPSCGTLVGAAYGSNTDPAPLEEQLGAHLGIRRTYYTSGQVDKAVATAEADLAADRLPWISFKLPYSWADMAAGEGDDWARDLATRLAALDGPVWVAFHHEPEGDGDIQEWRKMQERLAPIVRKSAPNVAFTVITTGWHQFYGDPEYSLAKIWPRDVKIDVAGFDIYQSYGVVKAGKTRSRWTDLGTSYFAKIAEWAKANDVAWGLAETGVTNTAAAVRPEEIPRTVALMRTYGGIAYTYFDTTLNSIAPWALTTAAKRSAFAEALKAAPALTH